MFTGIPDHLVMFPLLLCDIFDSIPKKASSVKAESRQVLTRSAVPVPVTPREQVGALPWRLRNGRVEVMLITSRERKRWIIPKGWSMPGKSLREAAEIEAWEEAGVVAGDCARKPVGVVDYTKRLSSGRLAPCTIQVFLLKVRRISAAFPEQGERRRYWTTPERAARLVAEPGLKAIFRAM
jgi:8-oxo-dGTP pyrophosphatase MutT (NUDIX family)